MVGLSLFHNQEIQSFPSTLVITINTRIWDLGVVEINV